jgi:hypothetical protein
MGQMTHYHSCQSLLLLNLNHVSNAQLVSMADSYGNVSFDPCEFTLHTAANAENND